MAVLAIACLAACTSSSVPGPSNTNPYPPLNVLRVDAAVDLIASDSTLIRTVGAEGFLNITGWQSAFYGHVYGTNRLNDEVFAYYDRELVRLGWKPDTKPILSSGELRGWGWCKPQLYFRLAIFDRGQYPRAGIPDGHRYWTVYDARLQGSTDECPSAR